MGAVLDFSDASLFDAVVASKTVTRGDAVFVKVVSCGCCSNGCVCGNVLDVPRGFPVTTCNHHQRVSHPRETGIHKIPKVSG